MIGAIEMSERKFANWDQVPLVMTINEAAEVCGVHRNTIVNMIRDGRLAATKVGREWRITKDEIRRMLGEGE